MLSVLTLVAAIGGSCGAALPLAGARAGSLSTPPRRRSLLATAWRAARGNSQRKLRLRNWAVDAAPAPAPAMAPAGPPAPPEFPVIGNDECELLQEGFLVDPPATCKHAIFFDNVDGCSCSMVLPASINPQPANLYNPFLVSVPPDPNIPVVAAMPTVPPPSNPMQPFVAPMMPPACPFQNSCADPDDFECVGYNSWGFSEAHIAGYSPAAAALNAASCSFMMEPYGEFKVPEKMAALWHLNAKLKKVFERMSKPITLFCKKTNVTTATMQDYCRDQTGRMGIPCDTEWSEVAKKHADPDCREALPPDGFEVDNTLAEICPLECGWKKGVTRWPPFLTKAELRVIEEKKKEEEEKKKKEKKDEGKKDEKEAAEKEEEEKDKKD